MHDEPAKQLEMSNGPQNALIPSWRAMVLLAVLSLAAAVRIVQIQLPGPYSDEIYFSNAAKHFLEQRPLGSLPSLRLGGFWLPLGFSGHTGALSVYIEAAFQELSHHPQLHRYINIGYALAAILVAYLLASKLWGRDYGALLALILAVLPSFVFYSRVGNHVIFLRALIGIAFFYLFLTFLHSPSPRRLAALALVTGLGFSTRLETVWLVAGAAGVLLIDGEARRAFQCLRRPLVLLQAIAAFAAGAVLFLVNNLTTFSTFRHVKRNLIVSQYGYDNRNLMANLWARVDHFQRFLTGSDFTEYGAVFHNYLWPPLIVFSLGVTLYAAFSRREASVSKVLARRLLAFSAPVLVISTFSVTTIRPMHLLIVFFLPFLLLLFALSRLPPTSQRFLVLGVLVAISVDAMNTYRYHRALQQSEGVGPWSTAMFNLVDYAEANLGKHHIFLGDWGLYHPLDYFSRVPLDLTEIFGYAGGYREIPDSFYSHVREGLLVEPSVFVFTFPSETGFVRREAFLAELGKRHVSYRVRFVTDFHGAPAYALYFPGAKPLVLSQSVGEPKISRIHPSEIAQGVPFNVQPDGLSAMAIEGSFDPSGTYAVVFNGRVKKAVNGGGRIVSASFFPEDYDHAGTYPVHVVNLKNGSSSNTLELIISPTRIEKKQPEPR